MRAQRAAAVCACASCGAADQIVGKFCTECGTRLFPSAKCRSCNSDLGPNMKFCSECGAATGRAAPLGMDSIPVSNRTEAEKIDQKNRMRAIQERYDADKRHAELKKIETPAG